MSDVIELPIGVRFDASILIKDFDSIATSLGNLEKQEVYQGEFFFPNRKHKISKDYFYNEKILKAEKEDQKNKDKICK